MGQFHRETTKRLRQPLSLGQFEQLKQECAALLDALLNEEYNLDRIKTRLASRLRRRGQSKPQEAVQSILNSVDFNAISTVRPIQSTTHKMEREVPRGPEPATTTAKLGQSKEVSVPGEHAAKFFTAATTKKPARKAPATGQEAEEALDELTLKVARLVSKSEITLELFDGEGEEDPHEGEVEELRAELARLKENQVYVDENVEVYCVYKERKPKRVLVEYE